jgi:phytoene synthase
LQLKQRLNAVIGTYQAMDRVRYRREVGDVRADEVWSQLEWESRHILFDEKIAGQTNEAIARSVASRWGRKVLRSYSSSFYAVTRFLPPVKRADVEMIYAAVRYPDEVVDSFPLSATSKVEMLDDWEHHFENSNYFSGIANAVENGIPVTLAGFRDVARRNGIPDEYYIAFLNAMRSDIDPQQFADWPDLIDRYIYGSASVVGYFLAHVYGPAKGASAAKCMQSARALAIALQLTNFARDVSDDAARGRCYLPVDRSSSAGRSISGRVLSGDFSSMLEAKLLLAEEAEIWYDRSAPLINAFNPDSRIAIESCHRLYSVLNRKILNSASASERSSLSLFEKLSVLPVNKSWRLPVSLIFDR